jgi:tRNA G18 (ribose-2'-O)-methylase SpoU
MSTTGQTPRMAELITIDDVADPRLGDYVALTDAELRKRYEHQHGVLIAEGPNPVRELVASPYPVRSMLVADDRLDRVADLLPGVDGPVYVVTQPLLHEIVRFKLHQGVIACGERLPPRDSAAVLAGARLVAVLEGLNDHENLGTLFRSARGLGVDGVLLGAGCADPLYRRSVRVSMGHVLHVPHAWVGHLDVAVPELAARGFTTVALTPDPSADDLRDVEVAATDRVALLLGAEGPGLSASALGAADVRARIPMHAGVDSLNVATAAAIAFHHLGRRA